jgi:Arc/MetJ-type ribon-helix-helix transcriptional regulator
MALGMAMKKITVTLPEEQIASIKKLIQAGKAESVSGFVQHAVFVSLADVAGWGAMLGQALVETGGPLTAKERAWADSLLRPKRRRRSAA